MVFHGLHVLLMKAIINLIWKMCLQCTALPFKYLRPKKKYFGLFLSSVYHHDYLCVYHHHYDIGIGDIIKRGTK